MRTSVALSLLADLQDLTGFEPGEHRDQALDTVIGGVLSWSATLVPSRWTANAA